MTRKLAAILAADVVGYSKLMADDEAGTLQALKTHRSDVLDPEIARHDGRIVKLMGDGVLVEFPSVVSAVECAIAVQNALASNPGSIILRIGINLGDVIIDGDDIYGNGVNVTARLEALAEPGGIAISGIVKEGLGNRIKDTFADAGEHRVKNIEHPLRVYRWAPDLTASAAAPSASPPADDKPSIAVLPFNNMSGDEEQGYFADGITEDIITDLSKVSGLLVIARNSSFAYKGKSPDIRQVCRDLDVRYVLEGSVRKAGQVVRINAQLIDGNSGGHVWAERYDRKLEDIFALQDEVTREIVSALRVAFTSEEQSRRHDHTKVDPVAYDYLVRARTRFHEMTESSIREARALLEKAIAIDDRIAVAHAALASTYCLDYVNGWNDDGNDRIELAMGFARRAIAADENEPQAYHALALANLWKRNLGESEAAARKAMELDPNHAGAYSVLANLSTYSGRFEEALEMGHHALRLDPQYDLALQFIARAQFLLKRYDEAEKNFKRRLVRSPKSDLARVYLASIYGHTGRREEAEAMWREVLEINPDFSVEHLRSVLPYTDPAWFDHLIIGLQKAGLQQDG